MSYPPLKSENYQNLGGLNRKASLFMTGLNEAVDLLNFDFSVPGAWTTRPGTTLLITGNSGGVQSFTEFSRLTGASWKIWNVANELYSFNGATSNLRHMGTTFGNVFEFTFIPSVNNRLDMIPFVDRLFVAGSSFDFFKTDGVSSYKFSIPPAYSPLSAIVTGSGTGFTGWYQYAIGYINDRGYLGPISRPLNVNTAGDANIHLTIVDPNVPFQGTANRIVDQYGLTAQVLFRGGPYESTLPNGPTFTGNLFDLAVLPIFASSYDDAGGSFGPATSTGNTPASQSLWFTMVPQFIDVYNNSLLAFGFSELPSTLFFSAIGEPESIGSTQSFEVRTNDGDKLTGGINYGSAEILFKLKSFHAFTGDTPNNYTLRQISDQYGCVSNRACAVYEDYLLFLDPKGICQFNGASVEIISTRVESTFRRMNLPAATQNAEMLHVRDRNEVWCSFPIDGSTVNNYLVIYDYLAGSFTEWFGPQIYSLALATDPNQKQKPHYGDYTGSIHWFSSTFFSDSGRGFTFSVTPRFCGDLGNSVTKQFRRIYFDMVATQVTGITHLLSVNLFADTNLNLSVYNTTLAISSSMPMQPRIDFGVPSKTMTFSLTGVSQDSALQFSGFTIEYRYQRNV